MYDEELPGHLSRAALGYVMGGNRLHGGDVAPAVRHIGYKMAKTAQYMRYAQAAYNTGRKIVGSFSQNKQSTMAPVTPPNSGRQSRPRTRSAAASRRPATRRRLTYSSRSRSGSGSTASALRALSRVSRRGAVRRQYGASNSTSSGRFDKPTGGKTPIDRFAKNGVVFVREVGGVAVSDNVTPYQSFTIGHATFGQDQLIYDMSIAWAKAIAVNAFKIQVEDVSQQILAGNGRNCIFVFQYKVSPAASVAQFVISLTGAGSKTIADLGNSIASSWKTLVDNHANMQFTKLEIYYDAVATTPAVGTELVAKFDLKRTKFHLYSKSSMKLQNRSVNSSGNNESDDVDNVPLYGKSYQGPGNYWQIGDKIYSPSTTVQANYYIGGNAAGQDMAEPLPLSQMKRMKAVGKAHIDPGHIKTSVITARKTLPVNSLNLILGRSVSTTNMVTIGKQRIFTLEKMIQAVATDATNGIRLAYEFDLKTGVICYMPKLSTTTMVVTLNPQ